MSIQSTNFNPIFVQRANGPFTIDSGIASGSTFDGQGHDFLAPDKILGNVDDFSKSISPVTSNNNFVLISDAFGKNADARDILKGTSSTLNDIFSPTFGSSLLAPSVQVSPATVQAVPVSGLTGTSGNLVTTNSVLLGRVTQTPSASLIQDLSSFNPLIWQNPNPTNILLGSMDAQNKIFGGNGLFTPPIFNQYPLYPFIAPPASPYSNYNIPIPNSNGLTTLQQAMMFPSSFVTNSPLYNTTITPYAVATTSTISPYQIQVGLMNLLQALGSSSGNGTIGTIGSINQLVPPNGVPAWIS